MAKKQKRRFIDKNSRKRKIYLMALLFCILSFGVIYANLGSGLDIFGILGIKKYMIVSGTNWDYEYKEEIQIFKVPQDGIYLLEVWGAKGGDSLSIGGNGGYSYGSIYLTKGTFLYIVTGGLGTQALASETYQTGGYNGGGSANWSGGTGGGASHIALSTGLLSTLSASQSDVLLVAGGGGGGTYYGEETTVGGCGGGSTGCTGGHLSDTFQGGGGGGTQTAGGTIGSGTVAGISGSFGQGGNGGYASSLNQGSGGGGGGFYGGAGGSSRDGGGGGGSGHVNLNQLISGETRSGQFGFESPTGEIESGHTSSGYARITLVDSYTITMESTDTSKGTVSPSSIVVGANGDAQFTITPAVGYSYASDTCGGVLTGNTLTILNVVSDMNCMVTFGESSDFDYTGGEQTYTIPKTGIYRLETWGAEGGRSLHQNELNGYGGYGGYSTGDISLEEGTILHIYVGGKGTNGINGKNATGGYNGGGRGTDDNHDDESSGAGGGATHIAYTSGLLSSFQNSQSDLLIVSGGGGGGSYQNMGGHGGGFEGTANLVYGTISGLAAGTQSSGYRFGQGGTGASSTSTPGGGGGGGYWGGTGGPLRTSGNSDVSGAGGSGYIANTSLFDKHMTCYECKASSYIHTRTSSTTNASSTPLSDYAKKGNGYAKITYITDQTYTVNVLSTNETKATIFPTSRVVGKNGNAEFTVSFSSGYGYISDTCGGYMQGDTLIIPNVSSNLNCAVEFGESSGFSYTGGEETFIAPISGMYKLKAWGAQGGNTTAEYHGGYGGYATGTIYLQQNDQLYVNVGGQGACGAAEVASAGGYNGGGGALTAGGDTGKQQCSGGGASHIATSTGLLSTFENNVQNLVIVAGGGGGAGYQTGMYDTPNGTHGGNGGGIEGSLVRNECTDCGTLIPATQTHAGTGRFGSGSFGLGSGSISTTSSGGGGGFYGGGSDTYEWGGSGGSGYIGNSQLTDKYMVCYDCEKSTEEDTYTISNRKVYDIAVEDASKMGTGYVEILYMESNDKFSLTYDDNGGSGCSGTTTQAKAYQKWGELCTPTRENYKLKEWNTSADGTGEVITDVSEALEDKHVYAIWIPVLSCTDFANDSWATIVNNLSDNKLYAIGCTKSVDLGSLGTHTLRVANSTITSNCTNSNYSETACGFVLEFADIINNQSMNSLGTNVGSWSVSELRTYLNSTVYNALPTDLKNAIIDTRTISGHGSAAGDINISTLDKLYLLSNVEVYGVDNERDTLTLNGTRQLDYYEGVSNNSGYTKELDNTITKWWLRSARLGDATGFRIVSEDGTTTAVIANSSIGVSPAFRLTGPQTAIASSFATDSWSTISSNVQNNTAGHYHVGDTKVVVLSGKGPHIVRIANMSTPSSCSNASFSKTACGFVVEFTDILETRSMNSTSTNVGGWPASAMRTYIKGTFYNSLPSDLKNVIINTSVISGHGTTSGESNFTSTDQLYLLATVEVYGSNHEDDSLTVSQTRQLDYYSSIGVNYSVRSGSIKYLNETATAWWLRCAYSKSAGSFRRVLADGRTYGNQSSHEWGISPAFRIG